MSEERIIENMRTILFAGRDTTAAALTWSLYFLAKNPTVVGNILKELKKFNKVISVDLLETSEYLNAVVLEVLRLYPSAALSRSVVKEFQLGKHLIPVGADVIVIPYLIHRTDENVQNPNIFKPSRWIKQTKTNEKLGLQATLAKATLSQSYLPFSLGKRNCVGRKLALLELRVMLLYIIQNFELQQPKEIHKDFKKEPCLGFTLSPKGVFVGIKPRNRKIKQ